MSCRSRLFCVSSLPLLIVITVVSSTAQVDRGGIVGVVTDPAGAVVAGAQVTVTSLETNQSTTVATDDQGNYAVKLLRIGMYSVSVEKAGFQKAVEASVDVGVNQTVRVDLALKVGSSSRSLIGRFCWSCRLDISFLRRGVSDEANGTGQA